MATSQWDDRIVKFDRVPAHQLQAHPFNPKHHPNRQREAILGSMDTIGWADVVKVNQKTGYLLDGHLRVEEALTKNENMLIPVLYVDIEEHEEAQFLITFDPIGWMAETDRDNLSTLLSQVQTDDQRVMETMSQLAEENGLYVPEDFPEYTEDIADTVEMCTCPNCGHEFPK